MVGFLSLFLSLVAGPQHIQLEVVAPVTTVEIYLDGELVATLDHDPWSVAYDLGAALIPHHLVAIGLDREGKEVDRAEQWINLPRARTEARLRLEKEEGKPPHAARLVWQSLDSSKADYIDVTFDGKPLNIDASGRIQLPSYDATLIHLLQAELTVGTGIVRTETTVGGPESEEVGTELTALPMMWTGRGDPPSAEDASRWLSRGGAPVHVVAVEQGPSEIVMVQDQTRKLQGLLGQLQRDILGADRGGMARSPAQRPSGIKFRDTLRVLLPIEVQASSGVQVNLFPISYDLAAERKAATSSGATQQSLAGAHTEGILSALPFTPSGGTDVTHRLADAVAVAGLTASASRRPRAVVLVLHHETVDESLHSIESVLAYLDRLRVPLYVWSPRSPRKWDEWPNVTQISNQLKVFRAIRDLREDLDSQVIVWVDGQQPLSEIELSPDAPEGFRLVGGSYPVPTAPTLRMPSPTQLAEGSAAPEARATPTSADEPQGEAQAAFVDPVTLEPLESESSELPATFGDTLDVRVIEVSVVVSDKDGNPIFGLREADFELLEDGQPIEISHFRAPAPPPVESAPTQGETTEAVAEAEPEPEEINETHLVIFVDTRGLAAAQRGRLVEALRNTVATDPPPGKVMMVSYDGTTQIRQTFTGEANALEQALEEFESHPGSPSSRGLEGRGILNEIGQVIQQIEDARRIRDGTQLNQAYQRIDNERRALINQVRVLGEQGRHRVNDTLDVVQRFVESLGSIQGSKALLYVGSELVLAPEDHLFVAVDRGLQFSVSDIGRMDIDTKRQVDFTERDLYRLSSDQAAMSPYREIEDLVDVAHASGVTFYTLAPPNLDSVGGAAMAGKGPPGFRTAVETARRETIADATCLMAGATGGLCQSGGTNLQLLVDRTVEDFKATYSLAFTPTREPDGETHPLEVKIRREGLRVRHRKAYVDAAPEDRIHDQLNAALLVGARSNPLGINLAFEPELPIEGKDLFDVSVKVQVDVRKIALLPVPEERKLQAKAKVLVTSMDPEGKVSSIEEFPVSFKIPAERLADPKPLFYSHLVKFTLAKGKQKIAIGLWDDVARGGSFVSQEIIVGER